MTGMTSLDRKLRNPERVWRSIRNTTAGHSHGPLQPMETKRNWLNRTLIFLALLSWAVLFLGYWVATS